MLNGEYYIETEEGKLKLPKKYAKLMAKAIE